MQLSLGFYLYDLSMCLRWRDENIVMLAHHTASISGLLFGLFSGVSGTELVATLAGGELTNLSLQTRWFLLRTRQYMGNRWAYVNDLVFTVTFGVARVGFGTVLVFHVWADETVPRFVAYAGVVLYVISMVWFCFVMSKWSTWRAEQREARNRNKNGPTATAEPVAGGAAASSAPAPAAAAAGSVAVEDAPAPAAAAASAADADTADTAGDDDHADQEPGRSRRIRRRAGRSPSASNGRRGRSRSRSPARSTAASARAQLASPRVSTRRLGASS